MNVIKLAEMTGVSKSTIYRAINGHKIKDSTKQRIVDAINENDIRYGFGVFDSACSKVNLAALIIKEGCISHGTVEMLKDKFFENGFTVIEIKAEDVKDGSDNIEKYMNRNFRSFVFAGTGLENECREFISLASKNRPVILINSFMTGKNIYSITSNEEEAVSSAVVKLSGDYGHKSFLYCISDKSEFGKKLSKGFENGIKLSGLKRGSFCSADCTSRNLPEETIASALRSNPSVTAIITQDEKTALSAAYAAQKLGLKIPRDVTIVGLRKDNVNFEVGQSIAYIDVKTDMMCDMAFTLSLAAINGKKASKHIEIPCSFVQKKSVAKSSLIYSHAI